MALKKTGRLFAKVVIAGVGLMGGSVGMALKKRGLARQVVGLVRRRQTIARAKALGAIDQGTLSVPHALAGAELLVMAMPLGRTAGLLQAYAPHIPAGCLVTDVGSAKVRFLRDIDKIFFLPDLVEKRLPPPPAFLFASSHPMAGSEKEGVEAARPDLFEGSHCLLIRHKHTSLEVLPRLEAFWRALGCRQVTVLTPEEHDRWAAAVSHLPHALAVCLVNLLAELSARDHRIPSMIGNGFRDTTRVAAGSPALWQDILMSNREEVCAMINHFRHHLSRLETALQSGEERRLLEQLEKASAFRQELESKRRVRQNR